MSFSRTHESLPNLRGDSTRPRFHIAPIQDEALTAREGRPMFRDEERVQYLMPGSFNQPVFRVTQEHKDRWPREYAAFKAGHTISHAGTPLEVWPLMTPGRIAELKALEIHTVEQAASLNDAVLNKIGIGGQGLKRAAMAYLDDAEAMKMTTELTRLNELLESRNAELQSKLDAQAAAIERLQSQMLQRMDAPSTDQTFVPGHHDPVEIARQGGAQPPRAASAMDSFEAPARRRGRPPNNPDIAA